MASVSSETLILFIASILVAASVAGTMTNGVNRLSGALGDRSIDVSHEIRTDIEIISDPGSANVYNNTTDVVSLLVKNTGSQSLSTNPGGIDVLVDGQYEAAVNVTVVDGTDWREGNVVRLNVSNVALSSGDHRATVEVNGNREVLEFRT
ncbi:MAG: flagellar protein G [Haloferacaceae archaeon]